MRLKSINKASNSGLNSSRIPNQHQSSLVDPTTNGRNTNGSLSFSILNQDLGNIDENSFDLDMDSGEDEIDVGTHADSMLINYNSIHHSSDSFSSFPHTNHDSNNNLHSGSSLHATNPGNFNDQHSQFDISTLSDQFNSHEQVLDNFAVPQHTATMSEADRKRAHHNALERKRRDHIKDSFHTLRDAIPNIKGEKVSTSRAQILKAATDYIKTMKNRNTVYQNDIDLIKKQNMDIENQIRQLEKSKLQNGSQGLNSNILIKSEGSHSQLLSSQPNSHIQLTDTSDDNNDFKYDMNESNHMHSTTTGSGMLHGNTSNVIKANNVLILTKPSANGAAGTTKKFKTIMNPQKTNLMANSNNFL